MDVLFELYIIMFLLFLIDILYGLIKCLLMCLISFLFLVNIEILFDLCDVLLMIMILCNFVNVKDFGFCLGVMLIIVFRYF